jgi:hypothetical protein
MTGTRRVAGRAIDRLLSPTGRRARASKVIATGVSVSATLAGVGFIAHADDTGSDDSDAAAPAPSAIPVAVTETVAATTTVVTPTTVLEQPGPAMLPTKSTEPALAVPAPSYETVPTTVPLDLAALPPADAPPATTAAPRANNCGGSAPAATAAPVATAAPAPEPVPAPVTETTAPPPPPPPVTTAPPPPPPTLPPLTAPPDGSSRGTQ